MPAHTSPRRPAQKRRTPTSPPARKTAAELTAITDEWWSSWRRANALGWDYLNAVSGLMRLNMNAFGRASVLVPPFVPQAQ